MSKKLRVRVQQRLQNQLLLWNILRAVRHKVCGGPYLCIRQVMLMTTHKISALDPFYEMGGRKSRYFGEVLEWYRGEDVGDLKRSELIELVENLTCLKALEGEIWTSNQKVVMDDKINQKIVMDEDLVQNDVMDEKLVQKSLMDGQFVRKFVMDAKIDPKVVMNLSIFKIGGWNSLQLCNQNLLEEFIDKNENSGC